MLDLRPSAQPMLDALGRRVREIEPTVVQRPPAGGWTAWYLGPNAALLARAAGSGPSGAIDVAAPLTGWTARLSQSAELDEPGPRVAIDDAIAAARRPPDGQVTWYPGGGQPNALESTFALISLVSGAVLLLKFVADHLRPARAATPGLTVDRRLLSAARDEASMRAHSTTLGCLVVGAVLPVVFIGGEIVAGTIFRAGGIPSAGIGALFAIALVAAVAAFRSVRRRFPPPPQTRLDRWGGRLFAIAIFALLGSIIAILALGPNLASVTEEEATWCLGPGAGYVDNAVAALRISRTWTADTARADPNFRLACSTAWDATHR